MPPEAPPQLLVVDDEAPIRAFCQRSLTPLGCSVQAAGTGAEALAALKSGRFDLVLTDIVMPGGMEGCELLEEVKHRDPHADVILMTGFPALETAIRALKSGAYDYLVKPFDQPALRSAVLRCLEKRRLNETLQREMRLRRELEAAYAELKDMEQIKEAFLSRVNHELRIPLTPAFLAAELLRDFVHEAKGLQLCDKLQEHLNRMQDLVESLLLFSDLKKPKFLLVKSTVRLRPLLTVLIERFRKVWLERHLTIDLQVEPSAESVWADPKLLETALKQLLLNAIRFNARGGRVEIRTQKNRGLMEVSFHDTGRGITDGELAKAFDGFYQAAHYLTRDVGGLGLGLALVKRIAEALGGHIRVQSQEGRGSRFVLALPTAR